MSPLATALLIGALIVMVALVVVLSRMNGRNVAREQARQASHLGLRRTDASPRLAFVEFLWRRSDRNRSGCGLLEGSHAGWDVKTFLFRHDPDALTHGTRAFTRLFAKSWLPVADLALDARTAEQRGVLVAVDYWDEPATFKLSGRRLTPRNEPARSLLTSGTSVRIPTFGPPARCEVRDGWFFLTSFYDHPKWLGTYVRASSEICQVLADAGALEPRHDSDLPLGQLF